MVVKKRKQKTSDRNNRPGSQILLLDGNEDMKSPHHYRKKWKNLMNLALMTPAAWLLHSVVFPF